MQFVFAEKGNEGIGRQLKRPAEKFLRSKEHLQLLSKQQQNDTVDAMDW